MPRIPPIDPANTTGKTRELLDDVQTEWGMTPNIIRTLANAPAALDGYLSLSSALAGGVLPAELREQIAVTVAQANRCSYCLAAHCAIGKSIGLSEDAITDARRGVSPDRRVEGVIHCAQQIVTERGWVTDNDVPRLRDAGYVDREIVEIIANVAMNIFTNYFNHVAGTELDFSEVPELAST